MGLTRNTGLSILSRAEGSDLSGYIGMESFTIYERGDEDDIYAVEDCAMLYDPATMSVVIGGEKCLDNGLFRKEDGHTVTDYSIIVADVSDVRPDFTGICRISVVQPDTSDCEYRLVPFDSNGRVVCVSWYRGTDNLSVYVLPGGVVCVSMLFGKPNLRVVRQGSLTPYETVAASSYGNMTISSSSTLTVSQDGKCGDIAVFSGQKVRIVQKVSSTGTMDAVYTTPSYNIRLIDLVTGKVTESKTTYKGIPAGTYMPKVYRDGRSLKIKMIEY